MLDAVGRQYPFSIESDCRVMLPPLLVEWSITSVHTGARSPSTKTHPSHVVSHPWQTASNGSPDWHRANTTSSEALGLILP